MRSDIRSRTVEEGGLISGLENYMHFNPVKRVLAVHPQDWLWSGCSFYSRTGENLCVPNPEWELRVKV
jgi:hypothetical protein